MLFAPCNKFFVVIILGCFTAVNAKSQSIAVECNHFVADTLSTISSTLLRPKKKLEQPYILLKGDIRINHFSVFELCVQSKLQVAKYDSVYLLVGYHNGYMYMSADNNRNHSFYDDSLYTFRMQKFDNEVAFRNALPLVMIDSIALRLKGGKDTLITSYARFCPAPDDAPFFEDTTQLAAINNYNLNLYWGGSYVSDPFKIGDNAFTAILSFNPLCNGIYPLPGSRLSGPVVKIKKEDETSLKKAMPVVTMLETAISKKQLFWLGESELLFAGYEPDTKIIHVEGVIPGKQLSKTAFENTYAYSVKDKKGYNIVIPKGEYAVIDFSGSWCKPCMDILSDVDRFQSRLPAKIRFYTIDVEESVEEAEKFYRYINPSWPVLYEPFKGTVAIASFVEILKIKSFPSFVLINDRHEILYKGSGLAGLFDLEKFINKL